MRILIIGGAGYIGGVTTHLAHEAGHGVTVLDDLSSGHDYNLPKNIKLLKGDVCDKHFVESAFKAATFDAVMHFAAKIQIPESVAEPYKYFYNNSFGTLNVIDEAIKAGVKKYIFSSTAGVYGAPSQVPITEDEPLKPISPYGWSKVICEHLLESYGITHDLKWAALRYFNPVGAYGGVGTAYPFVSHIVPRMLESMDRREPIIINGNDYPTPDGTCIRDYIHVADVARAHLNAIDAMQAGKQLNRPINLGSNNGYSVKELADTFNEVTGANLTIKYDQRRPGDPPKLIASNRLAKDLLGWQPKYDLKKAIQDHYNWFRQRQKQ